jgi:AcrR family transcriptional regulator
MKERIFRAAITLFAHNGMDNVTIEQIADQADVAKGSFFNYFENKEAVLAYFGTLQVERLKQALDAGEIVGTAPEQVRQVLELITTYPDVTPELACNLFTAGLNTARFPEIGGPNIWHVKGVLRELIVEGQEAGTFSRKRSAADASMFLMGQYFIGLLTWCSGFSDESLLDTVRLFVNIGMESLMAAETEPPISA